MTYELLYNGNDLLASDRTGSGKTLAYTLPILERFRVKNYHLESKRIPRFLILCPTRELACQVTNEISRFNQDFRITTLYGGASINQQSDDLSRGVDIIVATPGRLIDMVERGTAKLDSLETVCLDEADTMLQKGFKFDIEKIFELIQSQNKTKTQNIMFSATIPDWVEKIAK
jgi:ATP-dependent RNA helicase DDX21